MPSGPSASQNPMPNQLQQIATIEHTPNNGTTTGSDQQVTAAPSSSSASASKAIPIVTCDFASDMSTSEAGAENEHEAYRDTLRVEANMKSDPRTRLTPLNEMPLDTNGNTPNDGKKLTVQGGRNRALSIGVEIDAVSEFEPSSSDSGVVSKCAVVKPLKFRLCQPIFGKRILKLTSSKNSNHQNGNKKVKCSKSKNATTTVALTPTTEIQPAKPKPRDPEKEKRRIARKKEKRATLILGLIMGSFIACWLPFFFLYILTPLCSSCHIPGYIFALAFWSGKHIINIWNVTKITKISYHWIFIQFLSRWSVIKIYLILLFSIQATWIVHSIQQSTQFSIKTSAEHSDEFYSSDVYHTSVVIVVYHVQ